MDVVIAKDDDDKRTAVGVLHRPPAFCATDKAQKGGMVRSLCEQAYARHQCMVWGNVAGDPKGTASSSTKPAYNSAWARTIVEAMEKHRPGNYKQ